MAPWEIWTYDFPVEGAHPCVLLSNAARLANPAFDRVNVLLCRTLRGPLQREMRLAEVSWIEPTAWTGKPCAGWMPCISSRRAACASGGGSSARNGGDSEGAAFALFGSAHIPSLANKVTHRACAAPGTAPVFHDLRLFSTRYRMALNSPHVSAR